LQTEGGNTGHTGKKYGQGPSGENFQGVDVVMTRALKIDGGVYVLDGWIGTTDIVEGKTMEGKSWMDPSFHWAFSLQECQKRTMSVARGDNGRIVICRRVLGLSTVFVGLPDKGLSQLLM